jgi:hypothetical protein
MQLPRRFMLDQTESEFPWLDASPGTRAQTPPGVTYSGNSPSRRMPRVCSYQPVTFCRGQPAGGTPIEAPPLPDDYLRPLPLLRALDLCFLPGGPPELPRGMLLSPGFLSLAIRVSVGHGLSAAMLTAPKHPFL